MIGRKNQRDTEEGKTDIEPLGFDDYDLKLGDIMRGERATLGKSLLDVQRELRIKASYISAIENCDPSVFETPGFIAGFVRSYARYLALDPEDCFAKFCAESGFAPAHGMSAAASVVRKPEPVAQKPSGERDPFVAPNTPFIPQREGLFANVEPRALGSVLVLVALISGIGYGGWSVLNEVQRVQLAPVEQAPVVLSDLDPLSGVTPVATPPEQEPRMAGLAAPIEPTDRMYRPQALEVPLLVARDAPISTLNPQSMGVFTPEPETVTAEVAPESAVPQVVEANATEIALLAVRPAWVRVRAADGSVIFEKILDAGEEYVLPATEEPPLLRAGMSGSVYFRIGGQVHGPAGSGTSTVRNVALSVDSLSEVYKVADLTSDTALARVVAEAIATQPRD